MASSFVRAGAGPARKANLPGTRPGPNGTTLISSGLHELDQILGGGLPLGTLTLVLEDPSSPLHLVLLRYFLAQGAAHGQRLLVASPLPSPRAFLGTLPAVAPPASQGHEGAPPAHTKQASEDSLRIAWQYRRFLSEQQALEERRRQHGASHGGGLGSSAGPSLDAGAADLAATCQRASDATFRSVPPGAAAPPPLEFCTSFDLKRPLERAQLAAVDADCFSSSSEGEGGGLHARIQEFLSPLALPTGGGSADQRPRVGRVAVQSLGVPHASGAEPGSEWELLALLHATRGALRGKAAAALVTLPPALHSAAFAARAKHMADAVLSVECLTEDDEVMASMVTDFRDAMGLLRVHKLPSLSTQARP